MDVLSFQYGRKFIKTAASSVKSRPVGKASEKATFEKQEDIKDDSATEYGRKVAPDGRSLKSQPRKTDQIVTVFHKPTKHFFDINIDTPEQGVSIVIKHSNQILNLNVDDAFWTEVNRVKVSLEEEQKHVRDDDPNVRSIDELMWKPTKLDYRKLPNYYMNLSKIRLTG